LVLKITYNLKIRALIKNFKFQISNSRGITLVELIVVIFLIALFSSILISDFPRILKQFALSRATYKLGQDLRRVEDLGLSGVTINDINGNPIAAKGYGVFVDISDPTKYIIYADVNNSKTYDANQQCDLSGRNTTIDCAIETIDITQQNIYLKITDINNGETISYNSASINFSPPNPATTLTTDSGDNPFVIGIVLENGLTSRIVLVNTSGLINVQ